MKSFLIVILLSSITFATPRPKVHKPIKTYKLGQQQPDPQRVLQIQQALFDQGYVVTSPSGKWDTSTLDALRKIADDMEWQIDHVPDARVLILLGLGNQYSNPRVVKMKGGSLDRWQREHMKQ